MDVDSLVDEIFVVFFRSSCCDPGQIWLEDEEYDQIRLELRGVIGRHIWAVSDHGMDGRGD